jgi:hypothetical protein
VIPGRVRTDHGTENGDIKLFMEAVNGAGRGSCVQGTSTRNQRIERLWRDVFSQAVSSFYVLFLHMEDTEVLDRENHVHMFCLQHVFLRRVDSALQEWKAGWNNRPSTALKGQSPDAVWKLDLESKMQRADLSTALTNVLNPPLQACETAKTDIGIGDNIGQFLVPRVASPINADALERLR